MKYSTTLSMALAGLAAAKSVHRRVPVPDGHLAQEAPAEHVEAPVEAPVEEHPVEAPVEEHPVEAPVEEHPVEAPVEEHPVEQPPPPPAAEHLPPWEEIYPPKEHPEAGQLPPGMHGWGLNDNMENHVVMVWMNYGGGEENHVINEQVTVTETVTVGGHHTPPPEAMWPPQAPADWPQEQVWPPVEADLEHPPPEWPQEQVWPPAEIEEHPAPTIPEEHTEVVPGTGATHTVTVGGADAGLVYHPEELKAAIGDMVIFEFFDANHTATQSSFTDPCNPLAGGMDSGFIPNPDDSVSPAPQVAMQIMTEDPLWFYCAQGPHCSMGMVFSINPTEENTHAKFKDTAVASGEGRDDSGIVGGEPPAEETEVVDELPPAETDIVGEEPLEEIPVEEPAAPEEAVPEAPVEQPAGDVHEGVGTIGADGSCTCHVQCQWAAMPNADTQGVGAVGGMSGAIPMNM